MLCKENRFILVSGAGKNKMGSKCGASKSNYSVKSFLYLDLSPKYDPKRKAKMIIFIKGGTTEEDK